MNRDSAQVGGKVSGFSHFERDFFHLKGKLEVWYRITGWYKLKLLWQHNYTVSIKISNIAFNSLATLLPCQQESITVILNIFLERGKGKKTSFNSISPAKAASDVYNTILLQ